MTVHCLHLSHRTDRYDNMIRQSLEHGFDIQWHEGVYDKKNPKKAINLGHKSIIQYAKDNNMIEILVAEDDMHILHPQGFKYFLDWKPDSYDLAMGIIFVGEVKDGKAVSQFSGGTTVYWVSNRFYDFFLNIESNTHVDRELSKFSKQFDFYVTPKIWVTQLGGLSNNSNRVINSYNVYLENREHL